MKNLCELLETCPPHVKNKFSHLTFERFNKIILQNEASHYVYVITKGKAKVYSMTSNGVKYLDHIYSEYELFGELEVLLNKPTLGYVEALETCEIIKITSDTFFEWIRCDPNFSIYLNTQLAEKMYRNSINTKANVIYSLKYRLLFFLWRFLNDHNLDTVHKDIVVEGVGSNIRSINRVIKELSDDGIIEYDKGFIRVNDLDQVLEIINMSS